MTTSYQRDKEWEEISERWKLVPLLNCLFPVLIGMMVLDKWIHG